MSIAGRLAALDRAAASALARVLPPAPAAAPSFTVHDGRARAEPGRDPSATAVLAALQRLVDDPARARTPPVFFDLETTGLGPAAVPFLVGLAGFDHERTAWVRQWQLDDMADERAMWLAVVGALQAIPEGALVVTYNGASFDRTVVRLRLRRLGLWDDRLARRFDADHVDVLPICRRLWRGTLADCRLLTLEREVLGAVREGDPGGAEIAELGQRWLDGERGDSIVEAMAAVRRHNADDLLGLASLVVACEQALEAPRSLPQALGALRHLRRVRPDAPIEHRVAPWRAQAASDAEHGVELLLLAAAMLRAAGQHGPAHEVLLEICARHRGHAEATTRLAIDCEHRLRRPDLALGWLRTMDAPCPRRLARLVRKQSANVATSAGAATASRSGAVVEPTAPQTQANPAPRRAAGAVPGSWRGAQESAARRARVV